MAQDFSWEAAARSYVTLYRDLRTDMTLPTY
jgi:glycogen synthase